MPYLTTAGAPATPCIFCGALDAGDDRRSLILRRSQHAFLILNAYPYASGHLMAVPVLKQMTHLPIVVDPSHAAGRRDLVESLSLAAAAAGADGIIVEVHPNPEEAICDGPQALRASEFADYAQKVEQVAKIAGKLPFLQQRAQAA